MGVGWRYQQPNSYETSHFIGALVDLAVHSGNPEVMGHAHLIYAVDGAWAVYVYRVGDKGVSLQGLLWGVLGCVQTPVSSTPT